MIPSSGNHRRRQPHKRPLHVLLIDDDEAMRDMLAEALRNVGWRVTACGDASRWLRFCAGDGEEERIDLVVSDVRMPGMSGLDVMKTIKANQCERACPPTIFITAFGNEETHRQAMHLGASYVLNKPFNIRRLIEIAREVASS